MATTTARLAEPRGVAPQPSRRARHQALVGVLFLLPCLVLFVLFRFGPALAGVALSLFDYTLTGQLQWKGGSNFVRLWHDPRFWAALRVTVIYTVIAVPVTVAVAVGMALLVRRTFRGFRLFRSIFFLPIITSLVLAGVIFKWVFATGGPWSTFMHLLGFSRDSWLTSTTLVLPALAIVSVWTRFGYDMLIILARLQDVPRELEESALIDGAGAGQRFRYVVLPELKPALFFVLVIETTVSFQVFDLAYVMTGGGPAGGSTTLVYQLYNEGFQSLHRGYASAIAVVLFVLTLATALGQHLLLGRRR